MKRFLLFLFSFYIFFFFPLWVYILKGTLRMVHRARFGLAWKEFLRYQEEELSPPLTHQFLFLSFPFPIRLRFSPSSCRSYFHLPFFPCFLLSLSLIIASCRSEQEKGWMGPNSSAGEEGVFLDVVLFVLASLGFFFLHVFDRFS